MTRVNHQVHGCKKLETQRVPRMDDEAVRRLLAQRSRGLVNLQVSVVDGHGVRASWNAAQAFPAICPRGQLVCLAHLSARETVHDLKKLLLYIVKIGLLLHRPGY